MCGIFCSISSDGYVTVDKSTADLLSRRGPDRFAIHQTTIVGTPAEDNDSQSNGIRVHLVSTVLALRGDAIVKQPLSSASCGSVLCWNGEAWSFGGSSVQGNDAQFVYEQLLQACSNSVGDSKEAVIRVLSSVRGPYAFVFYDARHERVYYGRDCLGRRSLLQKATPDGSLVLSSVCDNASGNAWAEVEADGVYVIDYQRAGSDHFQITPSSVKHLRANGEARHELSFRLPFPSMNRTVLDRDQVSYPDVVERLRIALLNSLRLRTQHVRDAVPCEATDEESSRSKIAILFSGGLDCTILARLCHDILPQNEAIDLLNVAFENPRIHGDLDADESPYEKCPDRITGRSSYAELTTVCPGRRWRLVQVNVPYTETQAHRDAVLTLMHPHNTEMDLSISYALYFASRGVGFTETPPDMLLPYTSKARVLLSGLGADELFGGYQRHATAFARHGYTGLIEELGLDFDRLGKRNLGRDDRVISDSGKEARFPFLDEDFISLTLELPVTAKCDFGKPQVQDSQDPQHFLEPAKHALRLLAWDLGMHCVAAEKKRAIQFGARTAKMETGKTKGTQVLSQ